MKKFRSIMILMAIVIVMVASSGCRRPPKIEQLVSIETNETAFMVPLEGNSKDAQAQFMSLTYLEEKKVAAKRVSLPLRDFRTGRYYWQMKWIPTAKVIKVDRSPVTREWTQAETTGTTNKNESISVESRDSIGFSIGVNITARVTEEAASMFLYNYPGKNLADIVDTNVRGFVQSFLSSEFGGRELEACKTDKKIIFDALKTAAIEHFADYGVEITTLGYSEGLVYENKKIQAAIDSVQQAEMAVNKASQDLEKQRIQNTQNVETAEAERRAAQEFAKAQKAAEAQIALNNQAAWIAKWDGHLPTNILPDNSTIMMDMVPKGK